MVPLAFANIVYLTSGDRISGTIVKLDGEALTVETGYAGTVSVNRTALQSLSIEETATIRFADGSQPVGQICAPDGATMSVVGGDAPPGDGFGINEIVAIARGSDRPRHFC